MTSLTLVLALLAAAGLTLAWQIGRRDVGSALGLSVGSRALTLRQALIIGVLFEFAGAAFGGTRVSDTLSGGLVPFLSLSLPAIDLAAAMVSSLLAAGLWLLIGTKKFGRPVSTTHSIVGALLGAGLVVGSPGDVHWGRVIGTMASWLFFPVIAALVAFVVYRLIQRRLLENPVQRSRRFHLISVFCAMFFASIWLLGSLDTGFGWGIVAAISGGVGIIFSVAMSRRLGPWDEGDAETSMAGLQLLTAAAIAFAHGSNDVANIAGPAATAFRGMEQTWTHGGMSEDAIVDSNVVPAFVLVVAALAIALGLVTEGYKVMRTITRSVGELAPSRAMASEFSAALVIGGASTLALPISTTHVLIGAVVGVGLNRSAGALDMDVVRGMAVTWLITLPAAATISALFTWVSALFL